MSSLLHFDVTSAPLHISKFRAASLAFVLSLHFAPLVPFSQSNFDALVTFISGQRPSANSRSREKVIGWNFPLALQRLPGSTSKCQVQSVLIVSLEITDHSATVVFCFFFAPFVPAPILDVEAEIIYVDCRKTHRNARRERVLTAALVLSLSDLQFQW